MFGVRGVWGPENAAFPNILTPLRAGRVFFWKRAPFARTEHVFSLSSGASYGRVWGLEASSAGSRPSRRKGGGRAEKGRVVERKNRGRPEEGQREGGGRAEEWQGPAVVLEFERLVLLI